MKYREALEIIKKNAMSNNLLVTGKRTYPSARSGYSRNEGSRQYDRYRMYENDDNTRQTEEDEE